LIDSLGGGAMMSGELALMPRSNALAGVNPALGVSVGSRQLTHSPDFEIAVWSERGQWTAVQAGSILRGVSISIAELSQQTNGRDSADSTQELSKRNLLFARSTGGLSWNLWASQLVFSR
jgi:hypothetical protein